jgi:hypothetical protein
MIYYVAFSWSDRLLHSWFELESRIKYLHFLQLFIGCGFVLKFFQNGNSCIPLIAWTSSAVVGLHIPVNNVCYLQRMHAFWLDGCYPWADRSHNVILCEVGWSFMNRLSLQNGVLCQATYSTSLIASRRALKADLLDRLIPALDADCLYAYFLISWVFISCEVEW